jgi:hypothetical protein
MTKSIEDRKVFINLAVAVADALEDPSTPESLRDPLNEIAAQLIDHLSGGNAALELRALAGLAQSGDGRTRPETETPVQANPERKAMALSA